MVMALGTQKSYEDALGDGVEAVLAKGASTLEAIADGLNEINVHGPNGEKWTAALLAAEFKRLGV
jgi:hypothetical protein